MSDSEDDYLSLPLETLLPSTTAAKKPRETLTERKRRQAREAEERAHPKSKAELARLEREKRDKALNTPLLNTTAMGTDLGTGKESRGAKMMAKLGYVPGTALGRAPATPPGHQGAGFPSGRPAGVVDAESKNEDASGLDKGANRTRNSDGRLLEPLGLEQREGRGGIGADSERKRKFREEVARKEGDEKKRKVDEGEFRERSAREREEKRMEGQVWGAMKVCERFDEEDFENNGIVDEKGGENGSEARDIDADVDATRQKTTRGKKQRRLQDINVLWRGLVKRRLIEEREKRMKYDFQQSLSRLPTYDDPDEAEEDSRALANKADVEEVDDELDEEDEELVEFEARDVRERLEQVVAYLRQRWKYCFWCMYRYPDYGMEGCPGLTEEDHD